MITYFFFRFNSFTFCCITFDLDTTTSEYKLDLLTNNLKPYINYLLEFKTLRIFGKSGSGKSTIIDLLLGVLKPSSGTILIEKKNIADIDYEYYKSLIGYIPQDYFLFNGTIKDNILFYRDNIDSGQFEIAIKVI